MPRGQSRHRPGGVRSSGIVKAAASLGRTRPPHALLENPLELRLAHLAALGAQEGHAIRAALDHHLAAHRVLETAHEALLFEPNETSVLADEDDAPPRHGSRLTDLLLGRLRRRRNT